MLNGCKTRQIELDYRCRLTIVPSGTERQNAMAFVPVPDAALVTVRYSLFAQTVVNSLWFGKTGGFSGTDLSELAEAVFDWAEARLIPIMSQDVELLSVEARDMSSASAPVVEFFPPASVPGAVGAASMPGGTAWTISFKTGLAGRSFRGRNYLFGFAEGDVTGNQISAAWAASALAAYVNLNADVNTAVAATHVVASRYSNGSPRVTGITTAVETYGFVDLFLDSQRRRLTGRGT